MAVFGVIRYHEADLPSVEQLRAGYARPAARILPATAHLASLFTERRTVVPLAEVSDVAKLAFLAAEDASFYEHQGLDFSTAGTGSSVRTRVSTVQGGSTITQQVVKNLLLDSERTYRRKSATILARRLEQHLTNSENLRPLSEPHLSKTPALRDRRGGALLLRQEGERADLPEQLL